MTPFRTMTPWRTMIGPCSRALRRFARDRGAVSAMEFAIILPVMLLLYIGGVELGDGLQIQFKVTESRAHNHRSRLSIHHHTKFGYEQHSGGGRPPLSRRTLLPT